MAFSRQLSGLVTCAWPPELSRPPQSPLCLVGLQGAPCGAAQWLQPQSGGLSHRSVKKAGSPGPGHVGAATFLNLLCAPETSGSGNVRTRPCCPPQAAVSPRSVTGFQRVTKWLGKTRTAVTTPYKKLPFCRNADMRLCLGSSARLESISPRAPDASAWMICTEVELRSLVVPQPFLVTHR